MATPTQKIAVAAMIVHLRPKAFVIGYVANAAMKDPSCSRPTVRELTSDTPPVLKSLMKGLNVRMPPAIPES